jgi:hypothetical protein
MIKPDSSEKYVKEQVKKELAAFPNLYYFMPPANGYGRSGVPDIVCCLNGLFFSVECKAPARKSNVSELQKREGEKIKKAGGLWFVVYDDATLRALIAVLLEFVLENTGG